MLGTQMEAELTPAGCFLAGMSHPFEQNFG